jgi:TM2 domain-containing membrane protein YozV
MRWVLGLVLSFALVVTASAEVPQQSETNQHGDIEVLETTKGIIHYGWTIRELEKGLLFRTVTEQTVVVPFEEVKSIKRLVEQSTSPQINVQPQVSPQRIQVHVNTNRIERYEHKLKSPVFAYSLSQVLPGAGQFYVGEYTAGLAFVMMGLPLHVMSIVNPDTAHITLPIAAGIGVISGIHSVVSVGEYNDHVVDFDANVQPWFRQRKSGFASFFFSLLVPGTGLLYCEEYSTGLIYLLGDLAFSGIAIFAITDDEPAARWATHWFIPQPNFSGGVTIITKLASGIHAAIAANRYNQNLYRKPRLSMEEEGSHLRWMGADYQPFRLGTQEFHTFSSRWSF